MGGGGRTTMKPLSLRTKLLISIVLILVASYLALILSIVSNLTTVVKDKINRQLDEGVRFSRQLYYSRSQQITYSLLQPAGSPVLQAWIREKKEPKLKDAIHRWQAVLPYLDLLTIVDPQGNVIARPGNAKAGEPFELSVPVKLAFSKRKPLVSTELVPYRVLRLYGDSENRSSLPGGQAMMVIVVIPVISPAGTVRGAIVAGDVINGDAELLMPVTKTLGDEVVVTLSQGDTNVTSNKPDSFYLPTTVSSEVLARLKDDRAFRGETLIGSTRYLTAFEPISDIRGRLVGSLSVAVSLEDVRRVRNMSLRHLVASGALGILLSFGIAYFVTRRLTKPLRELAGGAQRIEEGDFDQELHARYEEEFSLLANSFNKMAKALQERDRTIKKKTVDLERANLRLQELNDLLERKVEDRTADLQMEMERLEAILTSMAEGMVVTDRDNKVILFNPSAQKLFDLMPHRVMNHLLAQVCTHGEFCTVVPLVEEIRHEGNQAASRELDAIINGKKLKFYLNPLLDQEGAFAGVVMSIRDVTAEHEMNQMKTDFISTVSHELKTPLTSMKGSLQLVLSKGDQLNETERDLLTICLRNTERLIRLISEILDLAKIEAGGIVFAFRPTSLKDLINYAVEEMKIFAASNRVTITNTINGEVPLVYVDHDRIVQVMSNLLANAVKFSPEGGVVTITAERDRHYINVSVNDAGDSIQWSDRTKLFKKFQKFDTTDIKGRGGTGLGLAICKEIIEKHHGKIFYHPGSPKGNTFSFTVPVYEEG
jgi:PAS domain S-box-containing protein